MVQPRPYRCSPTLRERKREREKERETERKRERERDREREREKGREREREKERERAIERERELPGKGSSNSHGAKPVDLIITMIKWIRTSRLSIKNSLFLQGGGAELPPAGEVGITAGVQGYLAHKQ